MHLINIDNMRTIVAEGLSKYINAPVIRSNQTGKPPAYPYASYTITTLMSQNKGTYGEYSDGVDRKHFTQTWSITIQSDDVSQSMELTMKAREWLDHVGTLYLNDNNVVIQHVGPITNRDNFITIEYEYRNGFDVVFNVVDEVVNPISEDNEIASVDLGFGEVDKPLTAEQAIEKLAKRI